MKLGPVRHAFDGRDRLALHLDRKHEAAQLGLAADQHRAGSAFAQLAPVLGAGKPHVLTQDLEQRLVHREQHLGPLAVDLQGNYLAIDRAQRLVLQDDWSIVLRASAHAQRSGAMACARLDSGLGSSGWTRIASMPNLRAGSTSFTSELPITAQRSAGTPARCIASSKTAGCGFRRPASTEVTTSSMCSAIPRRRKSSQ